MAALNSRAADLAGRLQKAKDDLAAATAALEASRRWEGSLLAGARMPVVGGREPRDVPRHALACVLCTAALGRCAGIAALGGACAAASAALLPRAWRNLCCPPTCRSRSAMLEKSWQAAVAATQVGSTAPTAAPRHQPLLPAC